MIVRYSALFVLLFISPALWGDSHSEIVLLGTGTPNPDPDRSGPAVAIVINGSTYLFDSGASAVRRSEASRKAGSSVDFRKLKAVFLTHLHSDHTIGLPDLIFTTWEMGRKTSLPLYGPSGTHEMIQNILAAYKEDIFIRTHGLEPTDKTGYQVNAHDIPAEFVYQDENLKIKSFAVRHGSWPHAFGYRIEAPDRTIVISGDTAPTENIAENCKHCDILIHEVYSTSGFAKRTPEWQKYHSHFHTSSHELAEIAKKAQPGLLILYHQLFMGVSEEELVREVQSGYTGKVVSGHDLDRY